MVEFSSDLAPPAWTSAGLETVRSVEAADSSLVTVRAPFGVLEGRRGFLRLRFELGP